VKLLPVIVTGIVVPRTPELGVIDDTVGASGFTTVNVTALVAPAGVLTVTFLGESVAVGVIVKVAVTVVAFTAVKALTVTPVPVTVIAVAPVRPAPLMVTGTLVPRAPVGGATEVSVGPVTVKVVLADPPGVVTVTVLAERVAVAVKVRFRVMLVGETTVIDPIVTSPLPGSVTVVPVAVKLVPVIVTGIVVPRTPELGVIDDTVGGGTLLPWNSIAPMSSKFFTAGSGLGLPKKSVVGAAV
jgi:hypothetical protein